MKIFVLSIVAAIAHVNVALAAVEQCRFIEKKADREACCNRQAEALAAKNKPIAATKTGPGPDQQMKLEDESLSRRLRSICRGC